MKTKVKKGDETDESEEEISIKVEKKIKKEIKSESDDDVSSESDNCSRKIKKEDMKFVKDVKKDKTKLKKLKKIKVKKEELSDGENSESESEESSSSSSSSESEVEEDVKPHIKIESEVSCNLFSLQTNRKAFILINSYYKLTSYFLERAKAIILLIYINLEDMYIFIY